jgi:hypothetical protein
MAVLVAAPALAGAQPAAAQPLFRVVAPPVIETPKNGETVTTVHLSGTTDPGTKVVVTEDDTALDAVAPDQDNHWTLDRAPQPDGQHTYSAHAVDADGAPVSAETEPVTVTVDTKPPGVPVIVTPAEGNTVSAIQLTGTTDPQSVVVVSENGEQRGRIPTDGTGRWQLAVSEQQDGQHTFVARAEDAFGNRSADTPPRSVILDTMAPAAPTVTGDPGALSFSTDDPGASFECSVDGGPPAACATDYSTLPPGSHTLTVRAVDRVGNRGPETQRELIIAAAVAATPAPKVMPSAAFAPPLVPLFHRSVVVRPAAGRVFVRRPGSGKYAEVTRSQSVPLGSSFDTKQGAITLLSVPSQRGKAQKAVFGGGIFRVTQPGGVTVLTLTGALAHCGGKASRRKTRHLSGNGAGAFRITGRRSTASIRGARWVVRDSCAGTLTRALEGVVTVRDTARHRTVLLRAGKRYLARSNH